MATATLIRFNSAFSQPPPSFFTGTGSTELVPGVFPIALNGRGYMIDMSAGTFQRQFDTRVRDSVDQSAEAGEAALSSQGLWRRSQTSWHYGAGQTDADAADSEQYRFNTSKGIDVWTKGEIGLLKDTTQVLADTNAILKAVTVGSRLYVGTGQSVKYTTDFSTFTNNTGEPVADILSMTGNGFNLFVAFDANGIYNATTSNDVMSAYVTGTDSFSLIRYVKGRLMAAQANSIYNFTASGAPSAAIFTHLNTAFRWVGFAGGQNHIYAAGWAGDQSLIYRTTIVADGTTLAAPIVAAELPKGEIVTGLDAYLEFILIGTTQGIRVATADSNGNLVIGPLINLGVSVASFTGYGKHVWFNWTNFDSTSTGLGRLDLSISISQNQPAYASDIMYTGQGTVSSVTTLSGRPVFVVEGVGVYAEHATDKVASGYLESGTFTWGIADVKFVPKWDLRCKPLKGTITLAVKSDGGDYASFATYSTASGTNTTINGLEARVYDAEIKLTLTRSSTDVTLAPMLTRWMSRAYVAPSRGKVFNIPILLHKTLTLKNGVTRDCDVELERAYLDDLVANPRIIQYQEGSTIFSVVCEQATWAAAKSSAVTGYVYDGVLTMQMRSIG